jgi:hypothetical protein
LTNRRQCLNNELRELLDSTSDQEFMTDLIYIGLAIVFFAAFVLYALGCEKL